VITRDSDALAYGTINTIWRPYRGSSYLVYHVPNVLHQLRLLRAGLTTLGVVSKNDYGNGIHNLGVKTNIKVIRTLLKNGKMQ